MENGTFYVKQQKNNFETKIILFEKITVVFEINIVIFVELQRFIQSKSTLNLRLKIPYLGILGLEFEQELLS